MASREWSDRRHYGWSAFLSALHHGEPSAWTAAGNTETSTAEPPSKRWDLGIGYEGAVSLVSGSTEWREGKRQIEDIAREQAERFIAKRPFFDYAYETTGEFFDVPSVLEGRPECWLRPMASHTGSHALCKLVVDLGTSGGVSAQTMRERMTAVCAAVLTLEACGNPVELVACSSSQERNGGYLLSYTLAEPGTPIDVARIVALAHPGFFRRAVFRMIELTPSADVARVQRWQYGECPNPLPEDVQRDAFGDRIVYVPPCDLFSQNNPTAAALLRMVKVRMGLAGDDAQDIDEMVEDD